MPRTKPTPQTISSLQAIAAAIEAQRAIVDATIKLMGDNAIPMIRIGTYQGFKDGLSRMSSFTGALGKAVMVEKEKQGHFRGEQEPASISSPPSTPKTEPQKANTPKTKKKAKKA